MSKRPPSSPAPGAPNPAKADRRDKLAAALRENLKRRKAAKRSQAAKDGSGETG